MFLCAVLIVSHTRGILIRVQRVSGNFNWSWLNYAWTREKKKNFSSWFNNASLDTIHDRSFPRFSIFSGFLSRIKKIETQEKERKKERKIHKFASFHRVKIILRYATIDRWRGRKRDERSRSIRCNKCDCSWKKCLRVRNKRVPSTFVRLNRWQSPQCCCLVSGSTEEREFRWVPSSRYYFVLMLGDDHAG